MASLRIAPPSHRPTTHAFTTSAPSAPGLHDTLRSRLGLTSSISSAVPSNKTASSSSSSSTSTPQEPLQSTHPLEARLRAWRATQDSLKMEMLRRQFGIAEPVRRGMELKIAAGGEWKPAMLGGSAGVHGDILSGRDMELDWQDVFTGEDYRDVPDFHTEMEARMKMNW